MGQAVRHINHQTVLAIYAAQDPTRTATLRNRFASQMRKRFRRVRGLIWDAIVVKDVFGIAGGHGGIQVNVDSGLRPGQFNFPRVQDKTTAFMEWLNAQVDAEILEVSDRQRIGQSIDETWQNVFIEDTYKRGVQRANYEMRRQQFPAVQSIEAQGGMSVIMGMPMHVDRLGVLYTRAFSELKGITDAMDKQISQVLTQGLADGDGPRLLARKLSATIGGSETGGLGLTDTLGRFIPAQRRAEMLARTETIRAHHHGMMQEYRNWGIEGVQVQAELRTAGDLRVCDECSALEGHVYTLEEAQDLIPVHPMCRCIVLPVRPGDVTSTGQVVGEQDPVLDQLDPQFHEQYNEAKQRYSQWWSEQDSELLKQLARSDTDAYVGTNILASRIDAFAGEEFPHVAEALLKWQSSPGAAMPTRLRQLALQTERDVGNVLGWGSADDIQRLLATTEARGISVDEYIKARAFNQAFMEVNGLNTLQVHRGIGGPSGMRLRESFTREGMRRTRVSFNETTISGWSTSLEVAQEFGEKGFWITDTVSRERVFMHHSVLNSITGNFATGFRDELENLIFGGKRTFRRDQLGWYD